MHNLSSRLNNIFAYLLSVLSATTLICFASTFTVRPLAEVALDVNKIEVLNIKNFAAQHERADFAHLTFSLQTELKPLYNWNVKQLFVYLYAEYTTDRNALNQVVLWDKIILRHEFSSVDLRKVATKYYFFDDGQFLKENNATLYLAWNVIPNAGDLPHLKSPDTHFFKFPASYSKKTSKL